jgi:TonB family protein
MRNLHVLAVLLLVSVQAYAQTTETKYYSSYEMIKEVAPQKAKFSKTISTDVNGVVTTTTSSLKNGTVTSSETFRGDEPYGIWIYQRARGTGELDYNFELVYSEKLCGGSDMVVNSDDFFKDDASLKYQAPKFAGGKTLMEAVFSQLIYPAYARRRGIQGKVMTSFTITKEGKVENIVVNEGVNLYLDKEAVRILRTMKFSSPPTIDGEPVEVCVSFPITFKLG